MLEVLRLKGGIGADGSFWNALDEGAFRLPRCGGCGKWTWPAHYRCGDCGCWDFDWVDIEPVGHIFTWTRNHAVSDVIKERRDMLPYVSLLVELQHAGNIRIPGILVGSDNGLRIGARVRGTIRPADVMSKGYVTMVWHIVEGEAA